MLEPVVFGIKKFAMIVATLALAGALNASAPSCAVLAQGSGCAANCNAAYGACYKATQNRAACEQQLQRCMQGCISSPRG
jgi:hypothetical protein